MKINSILKSKGTSSKVINELDVTPFLSLMVVLIPVLLVMVKFTLLSEYDMHTSHTSHTPMQQASSKSNNQVKTLYYHLDIHQNEAILFKANEKTAIFKAPLNNILGDKLAKIFNGQKKKTVSLIVDVQANHSYQEMVTLLDMINAHKEKLNSLSISVKEGF